MAAQAPVRITVVTNTLPGKGTFYLTVFSGDKGFPEDPKAALKAFQLPLRQQQGFAVLDLPPGTYALAAFYDRDGNGRLTKNVFGAPVEPYGFSNNARARFRAPTFPEAAFSVRGSRTIQLQLR